MRKRHLAYERDAGILPMRQRHLAYEKIESDRVSPELGDRVSPKLSKISAFADIKSSYLCFDASVLAFAASSDCLTVTCRNEPSPDKGSRSGAKYGKS